MVRKTALCSACRETDKQQLTNPVEDCGPCSRFYDDLPNVSDILSLILNTDNEKTICTNLWLHIMTLIQMTLIH